MMINRRVRKRGFTMVEIVVGVVITGCTMTSAMVLFSGATTNAHTKQCRENMMAISNLEQAHRIKDYTHTYTTSLATLKSEGNPVPTCPDGGSYTVTLSDGTKTAQNGQTIPAGRVIVTCSSSTHGKFALDIDTY
jgi:type II secretory pathway pseudopilin PulG